MREPTPELPHQQGISLDELSEAYAQAMGSRTDLPPQTGETEGQAAISEPPPTPETEPREEPAVLSSEPPAESLDDDPCPVSPQTILEAMLFVGNRDNTPLASCRVAELMRGVEADEIPQLVDALNRRYAANGCPYHIVTRGSGYRLILHNEFHRVGKRFLSRVREARLSQAAIDVLAIVAYQQPLTSEQVSSLRGRPSGHLLTQLLRRQLLRIRRPEQNPRTVHYYTTDRFLGLFGLASLDDLPQSEELRRR